MSNYESRLYAIAVRAPISVMHIKKVEHPLTIQLGKRLQEEYSLLEKVQELVFGKRYSKAYFSSVEGDCGIIRIDADFNYCGMPYFRLEVDIDSSSSIICKKFDLFAKALAALEYAKNTIDTPQEQVVMYLPVNEEVCRAILDMPALEKNISNYLSTPFDKDSVIAEVTEFLASIKQYEYKDNVDSSLKAVYAEVENEGKSKPVKPTAPIVSTVPENRTVSTTNNTYVDKDDVKPAHALLFGVVIIVGLLLLCSL